MPPSPFKDDYKKQTPLTAYNCVSVIAKPLMKSVNRLLISMSNKFFDEIFSSTVQTFLWYIRNVFIIINLLKQLFVTYLAVFVQTQEIVKVFQRSLSCLQIIEQNHCPSLFSPHNSDAGRWNFSGVPVVKGGQHLLLPPPLLE